MRMWMVHPGFMCRKHLLGEHVELHMLVGHLNKGRRLGRYVEHDLVEPTLIWQRHQLVLEMERRGYNHKSPLPEYSTGYLDCTEYYNKIDRDRARVELERRCGDCAKRINGKTDLE